MLDHADVIGIIGVMHILVAYFMLQSRITKLESSLYSILNLIGAVLILYSLFFHWNLASVIIEVSWIIISLMGVFHVYRRNHRL